MLAKANGGDAGARVAALLEQLGGCVVLDDAAAAVFDELLALAPRLADGAADRLCAGGARLAALYGRYVQRRESEEARALLAGPDLLGALRAGAGGLFAGRSFGRVRALFERVDFAGCRRFVMVGCGPLPVTLLHVADRTGASSLVGLERDEEAAVLAAALCRRSAGDRIRVEAADGCGFDYSGADVVYVANLVRPKAAVVARVAETARPGTQVVVREPFAAGALFAERGLDSAHAGLALLAQGAGDPHFLSREVYLEARR